MIKAILVGYVAVRHGVVVDASHCGEFGKLYGSAECYSEAYPGDDVVPVFMEVGEQTLKLPNLNSQSA